MAQEKMTPLTICPGVWDDQAREAFGVCLKHDTTGGLASIENVLGGGQLFEMRDGAEVVGRYVLSVADLAGGPEVKVLALAGASPGRDLTRMAYAAIRAQAPGAASIAFVTRRKGLIKKLAPEGFTVDGFILRKRLAPCH